VPAALPLHVLSNGSIHSKGVPGKTINEINTLALRMPVALSAWTDRLQRASQQAP
jgi:hypothetical protein